MISFLDTLCVRGTAHDTIFFPLLEDLGITHAISLGKNAANMAEAFEPSDPSIILKRQADFLTQNNFAPLSSAFISIVPPKDQPTVLSITQSMVTNNGPHIISTETMFTTEKNIPLLHKPADCPTMIIFAKKDSGEKVLGLAHLGRPQVNNRVTEQTLDYLFATYNCDPKEVFIAISPSIGPDYYTISKKDQDERQLLDLAYWREQSALRNEKYHVDVLGKILTILNDYAIPESQIEAYSHAQSVDTFALAAKTPPEAFSHRFAHATDQPQRNGRFLVAAQLN